MRARRPRPHRLTTAQRGYGSAWQRLVARAKAEQRAAYGEVFCVDCGITEAAGREVGNPVTGDHLRWPAVSVEDVAVRCRRCNSRRGAVRPSVRPAGGDRRLW